jgi:arabinose-5-phosphate isomerase
MVATFNSTGTPSLFLHASEAIHGFRYGTEGRYYHLHFKSGNSPEIKRLSPFKTFWQYANRYNGNMTSFLAKESNYVLNTTVDAEACPNNLAPTNSTTAQLVMGDALAVYATS